MTTSTTCTAVKHGTRGAYNRHGCRCPEALALETAYRKGRELRRLRGIPAPEAPIDATGTARRLSSLMVIGWSLGDLAGRLGVTTSAVTQWHTAKRVKPSTARRVAELYDELWRTPGPSAQSDHLRRAIAGRGYLPPLWWDDDRIDDPTYDPRRDVVTKAQLRAERRWERIERVAQLTRAGYSARLVGLELELHPRQVTRDLADYRERYGDVDKQQLDQLAEEEALEHDGECCHLEAVAS